MEQRGDRSSLIRILSLFIVLSAVSLAMIALSVPPVFAATAIAINPVSLYEGTTGLFNLILTTSHLTKSIDEINFTGSVSGITLTNDSQYNQGWDTRAGTDSGTATASMAWMNNSIPKGSFVIQTYLQFSARMATVSADTLQQWSITTIDSKGAQETHTANVTLKNDATPPVLSNANFETPAFFRSASQLISIQAADPESGVSNVTFAHRACSQNMSAPAAPAIPLLLPKAADTPDNYSAMIDLSALAEGETRCFFLNSSANGGEIAVRNGTITIDNTPPVVTALSPAHNQFVTSAFNISFSAQDALSPTLSCSMILGGETKAVLDVTAGQQASAPLNTSDGVYAWNVSCADKAGNRADSATRTVHLDTLPPTISFPSAPRLFIRGRQLNAHAAISDFSGIATTRAVAPLGAYGSSQTLLSSSNGSAYVFTAPLPPTLELGGHTLTVTAEDGAGHVSAMNYSYNVTYDYNITLTLPSSVQPGTDVTVSGTVRLDNGSLANDSSVTLFLPFGSVILPLNNQSAFTHTFTAPDDTGTFSVNASVTSSGTMLTYNSTAPFTVFSPTEQPAPGGGSGRRGRQGTSGASSGSGTSGASSGAGSSGASAGSVSSVSASSSASSGSAPASSSAAGTVASGAPSSAGPAANSPGTTGVGRAGGFLTSAFFKYSNLLWTLFVITLVIGVLIYVSRGPNAASLSVRHVPLSEEKRPDGQRLIPTRLSPPVQATRHDLGLDEYLRERLGK